MSLRQKANQVSADVTCTIDWQLPMCLGETVEVEVEVTNEGKGVVEDIQPSKCSCGT